MKIEQTALSLLTKRDYSTGELKQKLLIKGFEQEEIETVIKQFQTSGLLDDEKYISNFITQKYNKGYGPARIRAELSVRGITINIEEIMTIADNAWLESLQKIWQKRFKGKYPNNLKERSKQFRFLQYRGFTPEQIYKFLKLDDL